MKSSSEYNFFNFNYFHCRRNAQNVGVGGCVVVPSQIVKYWIFFPINCFVQPIWELPRRFIRSGQCKEQNETGMVVVGRVVQMFFLLVTHAGRFRNIYL